MPKQAMEYDEDGNPQFSEEIHRITKAIFASYENEARENLATERKSKVEEADEVDEDDVYEEYEEAYREEGTEFDDEDMLHVFVVHRKYQHNTYDEMHYPGEIRSCRYCFGPLPDWAARCTNCGFPMCERCKWKNPRCWGGQEPAPHIRAQTPGWVDDRPEHPPPSTAPAWTRANDLTEIFRYMNQQIESGFAAECVHAHGGVPVDSQLMGEQVSYGAGSATAGSSKDIEMGGGGMKE
jgi:hypothetical protein